MVERERARRAASHVQTSGIAASVESGIYPYSRRASSIYGAHRKSLAIFGANASQEGSEENIRERTRSNLTLDEELYDILFAFG